MHHVIHLYWDGQVLGGTINCGSGCLEVKTTALASDSHVARMAAQVDMVRPLLWWRVSLPPPETWGMVADNKTIFACADALGVAHVLWTGLNWGTMGCAYRGLHG